jgi:hypothetical protein
MHKRDWLRREKQALADHVWIAKRSAIALGLALALFVVFFKLIPDSGFAWLGVLALLVVPFALLAFMYFGTVAVANHPAIRSQLRWQVLAVLFIAALPLILVVGSEPSLLKAHKFSGLFERGGFVARCFTAGIFAVIVGRVLPLWRNEAEWRAAAPYGGIAVAALLAAYLTDLARDEAPWYYATTVTIAFVAYTMARDTLHDTYFSQPEVRQSDTVLATEEPVDPVKNQVNQDSMEAARESSASEDLRVAITRANIDADRRAAKSKATVHIEHGQSQASPEVSPVRCGVCKHRFELPRNLPGQLFTCPACGRRNWH